MICHPQGGPLPAEVGKLCNPLLHADYLLLRSRAVDEQEAEVRQRKFGDATVCLCHSFHIPKTTLYRTCHVFNGQIPFHHLVQVLEANPDAGGAAECSPQLSVVDLDLILEKSCVHLNQVRCCRHDFVGTLLLGLVHRQAEGLAQPLVLAHKVLHSHPLVLRLAGQASTPKPEVEGCKVGQQ